MRFNYPARLSLIYFSIGVAWIYFSDVIILRLFSEIDSAQLTIIQNYKGVFYVSTTAILLYVLADFYQKAQNSSKASTEKYAKQLDNIIDSFTDGFFAIDHEWKVTQINGVALALFGKEKKSIMNQDLRSLFPDYSNSVSFQTYERALRERIPIHFEDYLPPVSIWYDVNAYPTEFGLAVCFRDITESKKAQKDLLLTRQNLHVLINTTTEMMWSVDKEFKLLVGNTAFKECFLNLFGKTINIGDSMLNKDIISLDRYDKWKSLLHRALDGESFYMEDVIVKDDYKLYLEMNFNPIYDEQQNIIGVGCFARNISNAKQSEVEKNLLIEKLLQQNRDLEEFSYVISHNLRAPVARLIGLSRVFEKTENLNPFNSQVLEKIEVSAMKLDEVISDLSFLMEHRNRRDHSIDYVHFNEILDSVKDMLAFQIQKSGMVISIDFSSLDKIKSVKSYLHNIFHNLVSNAIKYQRVNVPPTLTISSKIMGGFCCLSFKDNGMGIDMEKHRDKLFSLYKRFHSHVDGQGIGLYLVKSQVENLKGRIEVNSMLDKGSEFKVFIPLVE